MKRLLIVTALAIAASPAPAQSMPELFQKLKAQVRGESWQEALKTMDALEVEAAKPGNEKAQGRLPSPLAFYRGVCDANLGQRGQGAGGLRDVPRPAAERSIDDKTYSKKAVAAFAAAQKSIASAGPPSPPAYQEFKAPPNTERARHRSAGATGPSVADDGAEKSGWAKLPPTRSARCSRKVLAGPGLGGRPLVPDDVRQARGVRRTRT